MKKYCYIIALLFLGCQPPNQDTPSQMAFLTTNDTVFLHKSHIMSVKTELYQPSFELQGVLLPKQQQNLVAKIDGIVTKIFVKPHDLVDKNTSILTLVPNLSTHDTLFDRQNSSSSNNSDTIFYNETDTKASQMQNIDTYSNNVTDRPNKPDFTDAQKHALAQEVATPIAGTLKQLYVKAGDQVHKDSTLAVVVDESEYQFVSHLPQGYQKYLKIGQTVNFTLKDDSPLPQSSPASNTFAGQIADITPTDEDILVSVHILPNDQLGLTEGLQVGGRVNYGDLSVGVLVPRHAIHDGVSLNELLKPPYKPATPLAGKIWVIRQDATVSLSPIQIVAYQPDTNRYLITGISQDSLIATANLPTDAQGKQVIVRSVIKAPTK